MSSSSKKKRPLLQQCHHCGCCFLSKDFDLHRNDPPQQSNTPQTSSTRRTATERVMEQKCNLTNFETSTIPVVEPGKGIALRREQKSGKAYEASKEAFPFELYGWTRRSAALVHPETLVASGMKPRSAVTWLAEKAKPMVLTLWPSSEVQTMRIVLSMDDFAETNHSDREIVAFDQNDTNLIRLAIASVSPFHISKMLLRPKSAESDIPVQLWIQLAKLSHFHLFLRSYFTNALYRTESDEMEVFYYGHRLLFHVIEAAIDNQQMEVTNGLGQPTDPAMEASASEGSETPGKKQIGGTLPYSVSRISPMCTFEIDWSTVEEMKCEKVDDSESLL